MGQRDLDYRLTSVLPRIYALTSVEGFPAVALTVVRDLLGGDKGMWTEVDRHTGEFRVLVDPVPTELAALQEARTAFMSQHPVMRHVHDVPDSPEAHLISDFLTPRQFHRLGLYGEFFGPLDVEDQITVPLTPSPQRLAGVSVDRGRFGFGEDDRTLLNRLQPHLSAAHQNSLAYSDALTARTHAADERAYAAIDRLTSRQLEIVELIAGGYTNIQIANELGVSFDTVRTHIENILRRLDVPNRTAAAICLSRGRRVASARWTATVPAFLSSLPKSNRR